MRGVFGAVAAVLLLGASLFQPQNPGRVAAGQAKETDALSQVRVIEMTAKKYEYTPGEIRVKKGTRVQLKVRATDRTHGFRIALIPEGAPANDPAGLRFAEVQDNWKLEKNQERVVEFVAERSGTYPFKCSVFCGLGHMGMKGKLVVEE